MEPSELADRFEMTDGSSPELEVLDEAVAKRFPIGAFSLLEAGDIFESLAGSPPKDGKARAQAYVSSHIQLEPHGADAPLIDHTRAELVKLLEGNVQLVGRLSAARPLCIELIPEKHLMQKYGFPGGVSRRASGLFWDHPSWKRARIALRQEKVLTEKALVIHEMAHAVQGLAFTQHERESLYRVFLRTYRSRRAIDEAFAIYSEREFLPGFSAHDKRAPGIYGRTRQRWNEGHVFTRFVRALYFPYKPLADVKA